MVWDLSLFKGLPSLGVACMPFGTKYLRMKADEYRALAASAKDVYIRSELFKIAERYDREAEQNEFQQPRTDKGATLH
jgi:hypothetical protein